ncbi:MAG: hypothetical protein E7Z89_06475 [Cyanobacteria bacterium SIG28]|nr:hypothetical protein [Cyanobacteria bacterium SIG28]
MATYSFRVKKGEFQLDIITTDSEFLAEQFDVWVRDAGEHAKSQTARNCKELVKNQIQAEEKITQDNIDALLRKNEQKAEPEFKQVSEPQTIKEEKQDYNESKSNLDIFYAPPTQESINSIMEKVQSGGVFDAILENSLNNPQTELTFKTNPTIKKDSAFLNYMNTRKIEKKIDYLLLTAYYFTQYEQKPRFTLKQLNAKLMQNIAVIIDHSVLQEAINRDYIECLPDLTGLVGASEYRLTAYGEKVLLDD